MNKPNRGKDFEKEIKSCIDKLPNAIIERLPDPMGGYSGVKNICDFVAFESPDIFFLECKSLYGNTLNYKSAISQNQWLGLEEKSKVPHCVAGVCAWFIDYDVTVFVPIQDLVYHKSKGKKSLNIDDITSKSINYINIDGFKKRTMFNYVGDSFIHNLHNLSKQIWVDKTYKIKEIEDKTERVKKKNKKDKG